MGVAKAWKVLGLTSTGPGMNNLTWVIKIFVFGVQNGSERLVDLGFKSPPSELNTENALLKSFFCSAGYLWERVEAGLGMKTADFGPGIRARSAIFSRLRVVN